MNEVMFNCSICGPLQFQFMSIHHLLFWGSSDLATQVPAEVSNAKCGEDRKCHPTIDVDASFDAEDPGAAAFEGVPPELHMKVGGGNCTNSLHASRLRRQHLIKKAETLLPQLKLKHEPRRHKLLSVTIAKTRATMKRKAARYAAEFPPKRKAKAKAAVAVEP